MVNSSLPLCERQPIHNLGFIQPHGVLMSLNLLDLKILQVSRNTNEIMGIESKNFFGQSLNQFLEPSQQKKLQQYIQEDNFNFASPLKITLNNVELNAIIHLNVHGFLIVELEPINKKSNFNLVKFYQDIRITITKIHQAVTLKQMCSILVKQLRKMLDFDRVLVYKYDQDWHGVVIAEDKEEQIESYLGLHYPATDIPTPARELYIKNWVRYIPNIDYQPTEIIPLSDPIANMPLDLTYSVLRGVATCHREYMQNWGVKTSMSISLLQQNKLWGLIAFHNYSLKSIPYEIRQACELIGQVVSLELLAKDDQEGYQYKLSLKERVSTLIKASSEQDNLVNSLASKPQDFLGLTNATGGVICLNNQQQLIGKTPSFLDLNDLIIWLKYNLKEQMFSTDSLAKYQYPHAEKLKDTASGILAMCLGNNWDDYIIWFRPEEIKEINWAGNPYNSYYEETEENGDIKLCPRSSFEIWKEQVALKSFPWLSCEIEAVKELRNALINLILRKANEIAKLAEELKRSNAELQQFAYVASHDLQEPLNQVISYVQLLEMRYQDQLDNKAKDFIGFAVDGVTQMQQLIDDLLAYSRLGSRAKEFAPTDLNKILQRVLTNLQIKIEDSQAVINYNSLPIVYGDDTQLMQLWQNLITNALKFKSNQPPEINIRIEEQDKFWLFSIQDNGIGMEQKFSERIFVIFQRLHTKDEYPGTGIGLTICKKIVERHGGKIWVESELNQGSTFYFTIAK
jgi:chemotaxis family two-component system sensor kinase Cph1